MKRLDLAGCATIPLNDDDRFVLQTIVWSRLRVLASVLAFFALILVTKGWKFLLALGSMDTSAAVGWYAIIVLLLGPGIGIYLGCIRPYRRDLRTGVKLVVHELIIRKEYFPHTGQYFISFEDVNHMHHEVSASEFAELESGAYFPVYFASCSRYPFTWRTRVTLM